MRGTQATELRSPTPSDTTQNQSTSEIWESNIPRFYNLPTFLLLVFSFNKPSNPLTVVHFLPVRTSALAFPSLFRLDPMEEHSSARSAHKLRSLTPAKSWVLPTSWLLGSYMPIKRQNPTATHYAAAINPVSNLNWTLMLFGSCFIVSFFLVPHNDHSLFFSKPLPTQFHSLHHPLQYLDDLGPYFPEWNKKNHLLF